ncbi:MAG: AAA family ATPase [Coriobacteriales bacterium]|nr:AAA family ATPase [Coriobacteriales bacterium]
MGILINPGHAGFVTIRASTYVDKSGLIAEMNKTLGTKQKLTCVSRPRRFGKSFATQMLCAYYDATCDFHTLFDDLAIDSRDDALTLMIHLGYLTYEEEFSGHGLADLVFIPRKRSPLPALVVELKRNESAVGAIAQVRDRSCAGLPRKLSDDTLLVGISYNKKTKKHTCCIDQA